MSTITRNKKSLSLDSIMEKAKDRLYGGHFKSTPELSILQWVEDGGIAGLFHNKAKSTLKLVYSVNGSSKIEFLEESDFSNVDKLISWVENKF